MVLAVSERKIDVSHLTPGMYVYRLDRDWLGTPYPMEGFLISDREEIDAIRQLCDYVIVDVRRSTVEILPGDDSYTLRPEQRLRVREYSNTASVTDELPRAREAHDNATTLATKIMEDVREGKKLSLADVRDAVEPVVQSVLRNADAFLWISILRKRDSYEYSHAINCSLLAATFGRHMGFAEKILINLASGGLLLDVGKADLPRDLLLRTEQLSEEQLAQVKAHVEAGLKVADVSGIRSPDVLDMLRHHHERHDGTGYPNGLMRNQIPLFGRMAAVIDSYDAMTSERPYRKALAPHQALQQIYRQRDALYQAEIVEQFMQCLSVYPTGSLVELNTGEVAIVMAQNQARRLRPRVMILTGADKQLAEEFIEVDLLTQPYRGTSDRQIEVVGTLDPGAYGIDPTELYLG